MGPLHRHHPGRHPARDFDLKIPQGAEIREKGREPEDLTEEAGAESTTGDGIQIIE
jgi:hypothetical protein